MDPYKWLRVLGRIHDSRVRSSCNELRAIMNSWESLLLWRSDMVINSL